MDGTLIDSMPYWHCLGRDYLKQLGKEPEDDLEEIIGPMSLTESAKHFQEHYGVKLSVDELINGVNELMSENYRTRIPAKPGVREYLEGLRKAGITLSVCSSNSIELIDMVLERLGLKEFFKVIVSCDEAGAGKHRPDAYLLTMERLGAKPEQCVIYEDAFYAIETARACGSVVIGVYDASCSRQESEVRDFCDGYIKDFRDAL